MFRMNKDIETDSRGYSLVEMLIVTGIVITLAVIPIALLRKSRDKMYEADALKSLRMMALAYENYWAQYGHEYPHYQLSGATTDEIQYRTAEDIWDELISEKLLPGFYSGHPHDEPDLLARGYRFTIFPANTGQRPGEGVRNAYAMALMPYEDSPATRGLAIVRGYKFFTSYPTAVPRKMSTDELSGLEIYTMTEPD